MNDNRKIRMIPVDKIRVINPRARNKKRFNEIVESIALIGLKRPITVSLRSGQNGDEKYDLVCGQGRLEAFKVLGYPEIPAVVDDITREDSLLMSLVENLARRLPSSLEMIQLIGILRDRGHSSSKIATKIGMDSTRVRGILRLIDQGEDRLLAAVQLNKIPIDIAMLIAAADEGDVQNALTEAYEKGNVKGQAFLKAQKIAELREAFGKGKGRECGRIRRSSLTDCIVRAYKRQAKQQKLMIKKARHCERQLLYIVSAFRELMSDDNFVNLLRAEGMNTMPAYLADKIAEVIT